MRGFFNDDDRLPNTRYNTGEDSALEMGDTVLVGGVDSKDVVDCTQGAILVGSDRAGEEAGRRAGGAGGGGGGGGLRSLEIC
jgi:hypothetical protein